MNDLRADMLARARRNGQKARLGQGTTNLPPSVASLVQFYQQRGTCADVLDDALADGRRPRWRVCTRRSGHQTPHGDNTGHEWPRSHKESAPC